MAWLSLLEEDIDLRGVCGLKALINEVTAELILTTELYRFPDVSGVDLIDEALRDNYHSRAHGIHGTSMRGSRVMRNI